MAIEGYVGRPGSGKSYTLTERAIRARDRGKPVFANYSIDGCFTFTPDQLLDLPPGLIIIDEAHLWFSARKAMQLPASLLAGWSQTRKNGWDVLWSTQHQNRIDRAILDVSDWVWVCSSWFHGSGHPMLFRAECYEPENIRYKKSRQVQTWKFFNSKVASSYNTMERLSFADYMIDPKDRYASSSKRVQDYYLPKNNFLVPAVVDNLEVSFLGGKGD